MQRITGDIVEVRQVATREIEHNITAALINNSTSLKDYRRLCSIRGSDYPIFSGT